VKDSTTEKETSSPERNSSWLSDGVIPMCLESEFQRFDEACSSDPRWSGWSPEKRRIRFMEQRLLTMYE